MCRREMLLSTVSEEIKNHSLNYFVANRSHIIFWRCVVLVVSAFGVDDRGLRPSHPHIIGCCHFLIVVIAILGAADGGWLLKKRSLTGLNMGWVCLGLLRLRAWSTNVHTL